MTERPPHFLATTALEDFWDTSKPILFLGEWCRLYQRRFFWEPLNGTVLENPWSSDEKIAQACTYVDALHERLLPILADRFNSLHKLNYSLRYWRLLLGPWLNIYLPALYDRYRSLRIALDRYPMLTSMVLAEESWIVPRDTLEFAQLLTEDAYNLQMYSHLLIILGNIFPEKKMASIKASPIPVFKGKLQTEAIEFAKRMLVAVNNVLKKGHPIILRNSYFSRKFEVLLIFKTLGKVWPIISKPLELDYCKIDNTVRSHFVDVLSAENEFEFILNAMLPSDIPQAYIEGFTTVKERGLSDYPAGTKAIFSAVSWYFDEVFKQWAARSAEAGTMLLGMQHGGNYGSLLNALDERREIEATDRYYTWGWDNPKSPAKVIPSSASKLSGRKSMQADNRQDGILFAATVQTRYLLQFPFTPVRFLDYLAWQSRFARTLPPHLLPILRIRCHREDRGWAIAQRWKEHYPDIAIEKWDISLLDSLKYCRLYVCDNFGTTFLEALSANKPSIIFWDPDMYQNELRTEAQPYYDRLREAEILHDNPESAANAVNAVYGDIESWWNNPARQEARRIFCSRFGRTSSNAANEWTAEFMRIIKEVK